MPASIQRSVPLLDPRNPDQILEMMSFVSQNFQATGVDLDYLFAQDDTAQDNTAPTNAPVPTGLATTLNEDGSFNVTLTWDYLNAAGPFGYALEFGAGKYVSVAEHDSLDARRKVTVEALIYAYNLPTTPAWWPILWKGTPTPAQRNYSLWVNAEGYVHFSTGDGTTNSAVSSPTGSIQARTWYRVTGVMDRDAGQLKLYINGSLVASGSCTTSDAYTNTSGLRIASTGEGGFTEFVGIIDDVRVWSVARAEADIKATAFKELEGTEAGLVAYWKFNEGSGTTTSDSSPNTNTGTRQGSPAWVDVGGVTADVLVLLWKQGTAPLPAPTVADNAIGLLATATSYTFLGLNPATNYRFGLAAARKGSTAYMAGAVVSPTSAPDWADINATSNFTGLINGTQASTVVANAADGKTAFTGTVNYRTSGSPNGTLSPQSFSSSMQAGGGVTYTIGWNYTQGSRKADGFLVFWKTGTGAPTLSDPHFEIGARADSGALAYLFSLRGLPSEVGLTFGVAGFRRTEAGIEISSITSSTSSPDWDNISTGTPNYLGNIQGLEQHTITAKAAGQVAGDYARVEVDGVQVYNPAYPRSWHLVEIDNAGQAVFSRTFDVWARNAELVNFRLEYHRRNTANTLVVMGAHEPQTRRTASESYARLVCSSGNTFGRQRTVSGLTGGATYTLSGWIYLASRTSGQFNLDVQGTGIDTGEIKITTTNTRFTRFSETFVLPGGTTSVNVRFFGDASPNFTAYITDIFLVAGSTAESGTNLVSNGDFSNGLTGWSVMGTQGTNDVSDSSLNNPDTGTWGVLGCVKDMGGTAALLKAASFQFRSAYICIGKRGLGEGNGLEVYAGKVPDDPNAKVELSAQIQSGTLVGVSGIGWSPFDGPGAPTNDPTPSTATVTPRDVGTDVLTIGWTYTQPALEGSNRLADGFFVYTRSGDVADPWVNSNGTYDLDISCRGFALLAPKGQQWSFGVAAYRKTTSGIEIGTRLCPAASPDWRGIGGNTSITTNGMADSAVTSAKIAAGSVTTVKIVNDAVTTPKIGSGAVTTPKITDNSVTTPKRQLVNQISSNYGPFPGGYAIAVLIVHSLGRIPLWVPAANTGATTTMLTGGVGSGDTDTILYVLCYNYGTNNQSGTATVSFW